MKKEFDGLLAGLEDDTNTDAGSQQRGKRADPNYVQVNGSIPKELHASLFFYLKQEGRSLSDVIEERLKEYVEERGGIIAPKRKSR